MKRKLLIHTDQYSVTYITGDHIPIGYVKAEYEGVMVMVKSQFNDEGKMEYIIEDVIVKSELPISGEPAICEEVGAGNLYIYNDSIKLCLDSKMI